MTRNLKALGLSLLAICALGAVAAQVASATDHEFVSDGKTIVTGKNLGTEKFQVGAAGTVECTTSAFQGTQDTAPSDTITVVPHYTGCTFGGQPATVNFNHCAYIFYSNTTPTGGPDEHANVEIECAPNPAGGSTKIEIHTAVCTILVGPQTVPHAVHYDDDPDKPGSATIVTSTAKNIVTEKVRNTGSQPVNGCLTFPSGAIGTYTGESTVECFKDKTVLPPSGTNKTTPTGTEEDGTTACGVE